MNSSSVGRPPRHPLRPLQQTAVIFSIQHLHSPPAPLAPFIPCFLSAAAATCNIRLLTPHPPTHLPPPSFCVLLFTTFTHFHHLFLHPLSVSLCPPPFSRWKRGTLRRRRHEKLPHYKQGKSIWSSRLLPRCPPSELSGEVMPHISSHSKPRLPIPSLSDFHISFFFSFNCVPFLLLRQPLASFAFAESL